jgi:hypothetical protein
MATIKVKIKRAGDPEKKKSSKPTDGKKVEPKKEVEMGVKPGEKDLPEVTVRGSRPDLNKETIYSDEYKSKKWHEISRKTGTRPDLSSSGGLDYDFERTEDIHKKRPGAIGKINVMYSDGTVKKLGESYTPSKYATVGGNIVEGPRLTTKAGLVSEPDDETYTPDIHKWNWKKWHKDTHPEHYQTKPEDKK